MQSFSYRQGIKSSKLLFQNKNMGQQGHENVLFVHLRASSPPQWFVHKCGPLDRENRRIWNLIIYQNVYETKTIYTLFFISNGFFRAKLVCCLEIMKKQPRNLLKFCLVSHLSKWQIYVHLFLLTLFCVI